MKKQHLANSNQDGIVSITVTVIFIMVISLTVLGFSQVARRNSQEALDKQLSSQAFYAAEVGMNDARSKLAKLVETNSEIRDQTDCKGDYTKKDGQVDQENSVSYSCLLVKTKLPNLKYSGVGSSSIVAVLNTNNEQLLGDPMLSWRAPTEMTSRKVNDCPKPTEGTQWTNFTASSQWADRCPFGVVRIDITPVNANTLRGATQALSETMTLFAYPSSGNLSEPRSVSYSAGGVVQQGVVVPASCSNVECKLRLEGLGFSKASLRARSMYIGANNFTISAPTQVVGESSVSAYTFTSQVEVDVTGKAQDVLRRIKVRVPLVGGGSRTDSLGFSDYALHSQDSICKRFISSPVFGRIDSAVSPSCQ